MELFSLKTINEFHRVDSYYDAAGIRRSAVTQLQLFAGAERDPGR